MDETITEAWECL
jgi:hypothetical protein